MGYAYWSNEIKSPPVAGRYGGGGDIDTQDILNVQHIVQTFLVDVLQHHL